MKEWGFTVSHFSIIYKSSEYLYFIKQPLRSDSDYLTDVIVDYDDSVDYIGIIGTPISNIRLVPITVPFGIAGSTIRFDADNQPSIKNLFSPTPLASTGIQLINGGGFIGFVIGVPPGELAGQLSLSDFFDASSFASIG